MNAPAPEIAVLYEDAWIVAVDKPAGIIVHGDGTGARTLLDLVRERAAKAGTTMDALRAYQPLQRLDRDTTGIVLISKQKASQPAFDALIAERRLEKRYLAIVAGRMRGPKAFNGPIGRDRHDSRRMRISRTGKPALTRVRPLAVAGPDPRGPLRTLLDVELLTGRKHQIRVHLSTAGHPILGDALYGRPARSGLMLHAARLAFTHPVTGERVDIRAPYPARFTRLFPDEPRGEDSL